MTEMGTRNAQLPRRPLERASRVPSPGEALIRTFSVSLVAIAAIAASLLLTRSRDESEVAGFVPAGENTPAHLKLDAIREAGF
jgi:hypothetical protein